MSNIVEPKQNHLLAALPGEVQDRLFPHIELVTLPLGKVLYESGDALVIPPQIRRIQKWNFLVV